MQPYKQETLYHFTYNLETRIVEQDESLMRTYGLKRFYENMPYSFANEVVHEEDRAAYIGIYERIQRGDQFATCDFRVVDSEVWSRVSLYRANMDSAQVEGFVQDVSTFYAYIIEQAAERDLERQRRLAMERDYMRLITAVNDTYSMVLFQNITKNTYHLINGNTYTLPDVNGEGNMDDLILLGARNVAKEFRGAYFDYFSREALLKAHAEGKKDLYWEYQYLNGNGEPYWVSSHVIFVEDPHTGDVLTITLSLNIEERKKKEAEEETLKHKRDMEALLLLRGITDTYDLVISANLTQNAYYTIQYEHFLNKTADESGVFDDLISVGISTVPDAHKEAFRNAFSREALMEAYASGKKDVYLEHQQYGDDGEIHWVSTHVVFTENPYNDDVLEITLSQSIDERIRKEAENKAILQDALMLAESANRAKSDFLSRVSHDIRTPMNAVIGYATIAASHLDERERVKDSLRKILSSGEHLQGLINDVLDMSRIEAGKEAMNVSRTSVSEIIRTVLPMVQSTIAQKQIELYVDTIDVRTEHVYADVQKMRQLLLNILGNAVKFTSNGGSISIKIKQTPSKKKDHAVYTFLVKDNGIGMSREFQKHIFETFSQERSSTNSKQHGTGLGMAIAKSYVDMMGGTISVESEIGKGSEFAVKLELRIQEDVQPDARLEQLRGYRALVVDDDFQSCDSVVHMLQDIGMRADFTTTGKEALFRTKMAYGDGDSYFAYIIDWIMPDMNGIELVRQIRKIIGDEVPIIILTAYSWGDIEEEAREAGVTAFCTKPLFVSDLTNIFLQKECVEEERADFRGERLLLVEDNDLNREIAKFMLEEIGFEVDIACDGQDAVTALYECADNTYQYVLMDVQMPIMDGIQATRLIRQSERHYLRQLPIIALTANAFKEDLDHCLAAGMNAHLSKPFRLEDIVEMLNAFRA